MQPCNNHVHAGPKPGKMQREKERKIVQGHEDDNERRLREAFERHRSESHEFNCIAGGIMIFLAPPIFGLIIYVGAEIENPAVIPIPAAIFLVWIAPLSVKGIREGLRTRRERERKERESKGESVGVRETNTAAKLAGKVLMTALLGLILFLLMNGFVK